MNKFSVSHSQNAVPTNLFATWEVDRSSPHSIPRMCSLALGKLIIVKELDRDVQSVFIAVKLQGSKRVLRSNEVGIPTSGTLSADLDLTFSLQYPHFIKRDGNMLQIMLQRKKRYKNRAMLGYKTLAAANLDLAQIIQSPITEEAVFDLISSNKDRRNSLVVAAQLVVSSACSTPADEVEVERTGKPTDADDNFTDDEETYSSDPENGSDVNTRELYMDEDGARKRKERRKHRLSSSSRQQNFIKAKLINLVRKFKQAEDEGLETDMVQDPDAAVPGDEELDFLYKEIEDLNFSDSCPENDDNISIVSTPKPKLRPFFDRMSHSSSQTEISSLRDHNMGEYNPVYYGPDSRDGTLTKNEIKETYESLQASNQTPAIDQSDSSDPEATGSLHFMHDDGDPRKGEMSEIRSSSLPGSPQHSSLPLPEGKPKYGLLVSRHSLEVKSIDRTSSAEELDLGNTSQQNAPHIIHGTFTLDDDDTEISQSLSCPIIIINNSEKGGRWLSESFQSYLHAGNILDAVVLATNSKSQLNTVFSILISKLQKFINSTSQQPVRLKIIVAGNESYVNRILQQFVEFLSSRSPEWMSYFLFLIVPLGKTRLGQYLSSIDTSYAKLFNDQAWLDAFDKTAYKSLTPTSSERYSVVASFDGQANAERMVVMRILEYMSQAASTLSVSVAEAMLTFRERSDNENSTQKFLPFISEAKVGANEFIMQTDSDKEDIQGPSTTPSSVTGLGASQTTSTGSNIQSSPAAGSQTTTIPHPIVPALADPKMGLQVDYWKDRDSTKYTLKTTFRSFLVSKLPTFGERSSSQGLFLDVVTVGKKNIMRLPGKKGKEKEQDSKSLVIPSINRIICTSKHQHSLLKVSIDGTEWTEVKFFQLSSHWSSHVKTFPIGVFPSH